MMALFRFVILCGAALFSYTEEQTDYTLVLTGTIELPASLATEKHRLDARIVAITQQGLVASCDLNLENLKNDLCTLKLSKPATDFRFLVSVTTCKRFSVNLPNIRFDDNRRGNAELGVMSLQMSEVPQIDQIRLAKGRAGPVFEIVLHNRFSRTFLINEISLAADTRGAYVNCATGGSVRLQLNDKAKIVTIAGGETSTISGGFHEFSSDTALEYSFSGSFLYQKCGGASKVEIRMPTALKLPPSDYVTLDIDVPSPMSLYDESGRQNMMSNIGIRLEDFDEVTFSMVTADADELLITGSHRMQHSSRTPIFRSPF